MGHERRVDIAIVGGGFAGTATAINVLYGSSDARAIALIERRPPPGRGIAYGTQAPYHLLNLPAGQMSAVPDSPGHFVQWLGATGENDFVPRKRYGDYVAMLLGEAIDHTAGTRRFANVEDEAISLLPASGGFEIRLASGGVVAARQVVLAVGQAPPAPLRVASDLPVRPPEVPPGYVGDPWSPQATAPVVPGAEALLVGTGLTALDVALALVEDGGAKRVHLVSRRAKLPPPQYVGPPYRDWFQPRIGPVRIAPLMRLVREEVAASGADWRAVVDALRPHVPAIWASLAWVERRRFLRHVRGVWEDHRNRLPPPTAERFAALQRDGRVRVVAGRLKRLTDQGESLAATLALADGSLETLEVARVVNCTGPDLFYRRGAHPLIQSVIGSGLGRLNPLGLGLDVGPDFRLIDEDGEPTPGLFALGAPTKGRWWEVLAVPELREQARELARELSGS